MLRRIGLISSLPYKNNRILLGKIISFRMESTQVSVGGRGGSKPVFYYIKDGVAVVKIDAPGKKENTLDEEMNKYMKSTFAEVLENSVVKGVVLMSDKTNSFFAGADIAMLQKCKTAAEVEKLSRDGQIEFEKLEKSGKPIVAAIMGTCMGGGLELALACHYRLAVNDAKTQFALPEVMLGLLPGAGGTQRLPKLIALNTALDMLLTGKTIRPIKAKKIGLVDQLVEPLGPGVEDPANRTKNYLEQVAISTVQNICNKTLQIERVRPLLERITNYFLSRPPLIDSVVLRKAQEAVMNRTAGNYPAPLKILDVVRTGLIDGQPAGYESEAKAFGELSQTLQSQALIGLFQGSTECKKNKYGEARATQHLGVVGAGLMGAGIANVTIDKDIKTTLIDTSMDALARGAKQISCQLEFALKRKKYSPAEKERHFAHLHMSTDYSALSTADVVIEAVFENLALKHKIMKNLEAIVPEHCIIATNTSALPIKEIASVCSRPERIIGMHYFSPVDKMQLLEIIMADQTSPDTLKVAAKLGLAQKKMIVVVKDSPGFFTVRCLTPMVSEVMRLLQEGVSPSELDELTVKYGFPVGMAMLADEVGLDIGQHVSTFLGKALGPRMQGSSAKLIDDLVASGFQGRKTGAGFYKYTTVKGSTKKTVNDDALKILGNHKLDAPAAASSRADRQLRIVSRFVNEALLCLQENIIATPSDGDIASVFGLGFPPFWGGPFRFVDLYGAGKLVDDMKRFCDAYNPVEFSPCDLLVEHARMAKKFYPKN